MPQRLHRYLTTLLSWPLLSGVVLAWPLLAMATPTTPPEGLSAADWQSIQQQIQARPYIAEAQPDGGFRAENRVHGFHIDHAPDGTTLLRPRSGGDWYWGLSVRQIGGDVLSQPLGLEQSGQTITLHWSEQIREWWINRETGLEQWFQVDERPADVLTDQALTVEMAIHGNLYGTMSGEAIAFADATGKIVFTYDRLKVWDAEGRELPARMGVAGRTLTLTVADAGAVYPLTIDPVVAVPGAYLKANNTGAGDWFGLSVAVSGDTVVVGAVQEASNATAVDGDGSNNDAESAGATYVFGVVKTTTTTITDDTPDPSVVGQAVTVSFSVTSAGGTPTGNVTVSAGENESCTATVAAGSCEITFSTLGERTLSARYVGDGDFAGSVSESRTLEVVPILIFRDSFETVMPLR